MSCERNEKQLPKNWVWTKLGDIAEIILGQSPPSSTYNELGKGLPFYQGKLEFGKTYPITQKWCIEPKKMAETGDVLISVRAPVGPTNVCPERSCIGRGLAAVKGLGGIETFFILYLLRSYEQVLAGKGTGTTFSAISGGQLRGLEIPIPPLNEQHRIVGKVEELFSFLDAGVGSLRKVKAQLKRYRQAVLKYAFEGKLTEEWRKTHKEQIDPETGKLEQISQENDTKLPKLPKEWLWTRLELITANHDGKRVPVSRKKRRSMKGIYPYYGASGIIDSVNDYIFDGNFLLIGEDGANLLARSTPIAFQAKGKFWVNNHAHVLALVEGTPTAYLEHYINGISLAKYVTGTAQPKLTQRNMNNIPIPLAPLNERNKIAEEIDRRFSVIGEMVNEMESAFIRSVRLRRSILRTAFEGKLLPQHSDDESAERLLERIKVERANNRKSRIGNQLELSQYVK